MKIKGLHFGVLIVLLVFSKILPAQVEYSPSVNTYILMHLNNKDQLSVEGQGEKANAELFGGASIAEHGWMKGALDPGKNGGLVIQTDRPFNPPYGHTVLEARIYL